MTVGERLRGRRLELGLTQRDLECDGVSYAYVSRIENGVRVPSVKALRLLAIRLGTSAHWLETGEPDPADAYKERCRQLVEIAKEERRRTRMWQRRCQALEAAGASVALTEMGGLAESLQTEVRRLGSAQEAARRSRRGGLAVVPEMRD